MTNVAKWSAVPKPRLFAATRRKSREKREENTRKHVNKPKKCAIRMRNKENKSIKIAQMGRRILDDTMSMEKNTYIYHKRVIIRPHTNAHTPAHMARNQPEQMRLARGACALGRRPHGTRRPRALHLLAGETPGALGRRGGRGRGRGEGGAGEGSKAGGVFKAWGRGREHDRDKS